VDLEGTKTSQCLRSDYVTVEGHVTRRGQVLLGGE
jgi:hypothetical protein